METDKQEKYRESALEARSSPKQPNCLPPGTEIRYLGFPWLILTLSPAELMAAGPQGEHQRAEVTGQCPLANLTLRCR